MPVGFFDSGVGGFSILRETIKKLPDANMIYVADSANCPWGEKDTGFIKKRSAQITKFLISQGAGVVVVACNSASVNAIDFLREKFPKISFVGVEPGVKPALLGTKNGRVAVLATYATSRGEKFLTTKNRFKSKGRVLVVPAPELVSWVENGAYIGLCKCAKLAEILDPVVQSGADQLVLGCTHFPFLTKFIKSCLPDEVNIVDTSIAVAKQVKQMAKNSMNTKENGTLTFYTSGNPDRLDKLITRLMGIKGVRSKELEEKTGG